MKRNFYLLLIAICVIFVTIPAAAKNKVMLSAGLRQNSIKHGPDYTEFNSQWGIMVSGQIKPTDDLLVSVSQSITADSESLLDILFDIKAALMYEFITEPHLTIYGGLGYQFTRTVFKTPIEETVSGGGIIAATQVDFGVTDNLDIRVNIYGSPWYTWNENSSESKKGANYSYQLSADYDFNSQWGMYIGYTGGSASIQNLELEPGHINGGFTAGLSHKF